MRGSLQHLAFLGVQRERATDQLGLVGVEHLAVRAPDLHPDDVVAQHAVADQRVEPLLGGLVAGEQPVGERRLYDGLRQHVRDGGGVVDRLALGQPASRERATDRDDDQHQDDACDQADQDATGAQGRLVERLLGRPAHGDQVGGWCLRTRATPRRRTPGSLR